MRDGGLLRRRGAQGRIDLAYQLGEGVHHEVAHAECAPLDGLDAGAQLLSSMTWQLAQAAGSLVR